MHFNQIPFRLRTAVDLLPQEDLRQRLAMTSITMTAHLKTKFYFIRHGETDWNSKYRKIQGHSDIALNERGLRQAQELLPLTEKLGLSKIISSDLLRARQTAECLTKDFHLDSRLREIHCGIGEGKTWEEIELLMPAGFRQAWYKNSSENMNLKFVDGETRQEVLDRVNTAIWEALQKYPSETLAFISHGFVMRCLVHAYGGVDENFLVPNCGILPFEVYENNIRYVGPKNKEKIIAPQSSLSI